MLLLLLVYIYLIALSEHTAFIEILNGTKVTYSIFSNLCHIPFTLDNTNKLGFEILITQAGGLTQTWRIEKVEPES